jgi:hypothetical protein
VFDAFFVKLHIELADEVAEGVVGGEIVVHVWIPLFKTYHKNLIAWSIQRGAQR